MSDKPASAPSVKYGWEIADEVQRFVSNTSEISFVPMSALTEAKADIADLRFKVQDTANSLKNYKEMVAFNLANIEREIERARQLKIAVDKATDIIAAKDAEIDKLNADLKVYQRPRLTSAGATIKQYQETLKARDAEILAKERDRQGLMKSFAEMSRCNDMHFDKLTAANEMCERLADALEWRDEYSEAKLKERLSEYAKWKGQG